MRRSRVYLKPKTFSGLGARIVPGLRGAAFLVEESRQVRAWTARTSDYIL
jgi:hypothetical protein